MHAQRDVTRQVVVARTFGVWGQAADHCQGGRAQVVVRHSPARNAAGALLGSTASGAHAPCHLLDGPEPGRGAKWFPRIQAGGHRGKSQPSGARGVDDRDARSVAGRVGRECRGVSLRPQFRRHHGEKLGQDDGADDIAVRGCA